MRRQDVLLFALVLLVLVWLGAAGGGSELTEAIDAVASPIINGPLVGPATTTGADGIVPDDPAELAAAAGLDIETYSLARALMSEHGQDPDAYLVAAGWAIKNFAAEQGRTITALLTDGKGDAGDGRYGRQSAAAGTKYADTHQDPRERHVRIASEIMAGDIRDPTGGATHFFSPKAQDALAAKDPKWKPAADLLASWTAPYGLYPQGAHVVAVSGVDPYRLTLLARGVG
jgi:Cell Wall Hydrolase